MLRNSRANWALEVRHEMANLYRDMQTKLSGDIPSDRAAGGRKVVLFSVLAFVTVLSISCRMDMQDQPKYKPYRSSTFFSDGSSMRQPPEGTIARGYLRDDKQFFDGKMPSAPGAANANAARATGAAQEADVTTFPFPITEDVMNRGKQRYDIYCSVCHGMTGHGDGMIIRRGFKRTPPRYDDPRLLTSAVGHFFDVITNGWGAMPSYAQQIPVEDRWAIIAYVRALQRSQTGFAGAAGPNANANTNAGNMNSNTPALAPSNSAQNKAGGQR